MEPTLVSFGRDRTSAAFRSGLPLRSIPSERVPPSITCSEPVIEPPRGDTRKVIRSATSCGLAGRPSGMPPSDCMTIRLPPSQSVPAWAAKRSASAAAASVSIQPGETRPTRTPFGVTSFDSALL